MSTFAVLLLCIQACLVQIPAGHAMFIMGSSALTALENVFSQCLGAYGPGIAPAISPATPCGYGAGVGGLAYPGAGFAGAYPGAGFAGAYPGAGCGAYGAGFAPYGGAGEGNVAVFGELPVAGNTAVAGQVPIMGAVRFDGPVPAAGAVSISGNCACGCGSPYMY